MILYFADRRLNIIGRASTELPEGLTLDADLLADEVDTGVSTFECKIPFNDKTQALVDSCTEVGNYLLLSSDDEDRFHTIIDSEKDTKSRTVYIYAEDAGLDLLNEICGEFEADKAYGIDYYVNKFAYDSGFVIGLNEVPNLTRKLSWDGETTATERLASVATQFDGCEISYSFKVEGMRVTKKYINIYKKRGADIGVTLRLNRDIDRIVTKKTIGNLATAFKVTGGIPEDGEVPINLSGYEYDDGEYFLEGTYLKSRSAVAFWSRYLAESGDYTGHICRTFTYDTTSQEELCNRAVAALKKASQVEVNYEVDISRLPKNVKIGDRVNIVDDAGELYVSARVLKLERSVADQVQKATLGEYLIKSGGISQKVYELAEKLSAVAHSSAQALAVANKAKTAAVEAQTQANTAAQDAANALTKADNAQAAADTATQSAANAKTAADNAQAAVDTVEKSVEELEITVTNAQTAAENAQTAANTAQTKATEAEEAAAQARADAADASAAVEVAQGKAETAITKAETAQSTADTAKSEAATAQATADAAKLDAEKAHDDILALGESLETVSNTMQADYARKTELTETEANLQSQISQNAGLLSSTVSMLATIDETANSAQDQAEKARKRAEAAQEQAEQALLDAQAAQTAADEAAQAATNAQAQADTAKAAADEARLVADQAEAELEAAIADFETVSSRADATEEEIAQAQKAVEDAQAAADKAKADADTAKKTAAEAQATADTATKNAEQAQAAADTASSYASIAQAVANEAKNASEAQKAADEAATVAVNAQSTADTAKANADDAQAKANQAATDAANAQAVADEADAKAAQAASDLATAQQNLANVTSRVDATEAEVEAAQAAVEAAQSAADTAQAEAEAAQAAADTAKADAATAQTVANNAKTAADTAKAEAEAAQQAADDAQAAVDSLAVRVTSAETKIEQNAEQIALRATKTEVAETLGGYYTKEETEAAISVKADEINQSVENKTAELSTSINQTAERLEVEISDAAKKATDYLSYDASGGLQVGNKTSGNWSGYRTQMKSDSFNVLDKNGVEVASYGANEVHLGKNNQNSVIKFCNDKGRVSFDTEHDALRLQADNLRIRGNGGHLYTVADTSVPNGDGTNFLRQASMFMYAESDTSVHISAVSGVYDSDGASVGSRELSDMWVNPDGIDIASYPSDGYIRLVAPTVTVEGDMGITGDYHDNSGQVIRNGLVAYTGADDAGIDPNTTLEELILTSHTNAPKGKGYFYYIRTMFYHKSTTFARSQIAFPYNSNGSLYFRYYKSGAWSEWTKYMTMDETYPVGSIVIRYDHTSPASLYGGSWTRISPYFLYATGATGTIGETGGSTSHTLPLNSNGYAKIVVSGSNKNVQAAFITVPSWSHTRTGTLSAMSTASATATYGTPLAGTTGSGELYPPFIKVSVWRRTA